MLTAQHLTNLIKKSQNQRMYNRGGHLKQNITYNLPLFDNQKWQKESKDHLF